MRRHQRIYLQAESFGEIRILWVGADGEDDDDSIVVASGLASINAYEG